MDLFKRFPKFRPLAHGSEPLVSPHEQEKFAGFADDFLILDEVLVPAYVRLDQEAIVRQNAYRWMYVILVFGGALATILGVARLEFAVEAIGLAGALAAAVAGGIALTLQALHYHGRYLNARLAAEQLRGEYFLFLGRIGPYADEATRAAHLKNRVASIKHEGERDEPV
ncbi:MAG TPA: DUF4231 domain-containing protein [Ktedonobacteraceae bacterium]|jgi:hypothetical protein